ncbi:S8 family serine peptidase [Paenibacillus xylaniclasticus]|uniref:S8 family serine peptidase n=1 Tax=Paenibacillus xylaniclasticus TaxID=588083 RepID=UPI0013E09488|nr:MULTISPECIES: S8 family serine peptidase [Paenibacillus]
MQAIADRMQEALNVNNFDYKPEDEVRVIVELEQASSLQKINSQGKSLARTTPNEMKQMRADIINYQTQVIKKLDQSGLSFKKRASFTNTMNGWSGTIKYKDLQRLQAMSQVKAVHIANQYKRDLVSEASAASRVQNQLQSYSLLGDDLTIAILDDGVDYRFPEFAGNGTSKPVSTQDLTESGGYTSKVIGGYNWADRNNDIIPSFIGHGTHVAAIAAGQGNPVHPEFGVGVAPNARILAEKVFSNDPEVDFAMSDDIIAGIDHAITYKADVINISISSPAGYVSSDQPELLAVQRAVDAGIVVTISGGNYGHAFYPDMPEWNDYGTIGTPAVWSAAISVAASGQSETDGSLHIASFSSRGPIPDLGLKPDITAPGTDIIKPTIYDSDEPYQAYNGTSMASPYIAGASALVKEAFKNKGLSPSVAQIRAALTNTAEIIKQENGLPYLPNAQGAGSVRIEQAIQTPAVVMSEKEESSISLREISHSTQFTLQVTNLSNRSLTYTVSNNGVFTENITDVGVTASLIDGAVVSTGLPHNQITLSAYETKKFIVTLTLPDGAASEQYVGGWVELTSDHVPSLTIPFFGYVGDWASISMLNEVAKHNGLDNFLNTMIPTGIYESNGYIPSGYDYTFNTIDPDKVAFSPMAQPGIMFNYQLLRHAKKQIFQVVDEQGQVWVEYKFDDVKKGFMKNYSWFWNNALPMLWDGTYFNTKTGRQQIVPEGKYTLRINTLPQSGNENIADDWQSIETDLRVDLTRPTLDVTLSQQADGVRVDYVGSDMGGSDLWGYDIRLDDQIIMYDYLDPASTSFFIPNVPLGEHKVTVQVWDYAMNTQEVNEMITITSPYLTLEPSENEIYAPDGTVELSFQASDEVASVVLIEDGAILDEALQGAHRLHAVLEAGEHSLVVQAYDVDGNLLTESDVIRVYVNAIVESGIRGPIVEGQDAVIHYSIHEQAVSAVKRVEARLYDGVQELGSGVQASIGQSNVITVSQILGTTEAVLYTIDAYDDQGRIVGTDSGYIPALELQKIEIQAIDQAYAQFNTDLYKISDFTDDAPLEIHLSVTDAVYGTNVYYQSYTQGMDEWTYLKSVNGTDRQSVISIQRSELPADIISAFRLKFEGYTESNTLLAFNKTIELFSYNQGVLRTLSSENEWPVLSAMNNTISWTVDPNAKQPIRYDYSLNWGDAALNFSSTSTGLASIDAVSHSITFDPGQLTAEQRFGALFIDAYDENDQIIGRLFYPIRVDQSKPLLNIYGLPISAFQILDISQVELSNVLISDRESDVNVAINGQLGDWISIPVYNSFYYGSLRLVSGVLKLPEGKQVIAIEAADEGGNRTRLDRTVLVDISAPTISWDHTNIYQTEESSVNLSVTVSDDYSLHSILVNGNTLYWDSQGINYGKRAEKAIVQKFDLSMGRNFIKVEAYDKAGNYADQTIEIERVIPTIPDTGGVQPQPGGGGNAGGGNAGGQHPQPGDTDGDGGGNSGGQRPQEGGEPPQEGNVPPQEGVEPPQEGSEPPQSGSGVLTVIPTQPSNQTVVLRNGNLELPSHALHRSEVQQQGEEQIEITIQPSELKEALQFLLSSSSIEAEQKKIIVNLEDVKQSVVVRLPAEILADEAAADQGVVIQIRANEMTYDLPLQALDIQSIANKLDVSLSELDIVVGLSVAGNELAQAAQELIRTNGLKVISPVIDFSVAAQSNGNELAIESFGSYYAARSFIIPTSVQSSKAAVLRIDLNAKQLSFAPAVFKPLSGGRTEVIMKRNGNSLYAVITQDKTFSDIHGHWAQQAIEQLASKQIIFGQKSGLFSPSQKATRAEFSSILSRALNLTDGGTSEFQDVKESDWYYGDVRAAASAQLIFGRDGNRFAPNDFITREEMAVIVARALQFIASSSGTAMAEHSSADLDKFKDMNQISSWARDSVQLLLAKHIIEGVSSTTYAPSRTVSRAEMTVVLKRLLEAIEFIN